MTLRRLCGVALCLAVGATVSGCESSAAQAPLVVGQGSIAAGTVTVDDDAISAELTAQHRHHHAGFAGFVMMAVETIGVTPEQRTAIDDAKAAFRARTQPVRDANALVLQALGA